MQLTSYVVIWSILALIVLGLALVRYLASLHEDNNTHISGAGERLITKQKAFFSKVDTVDRWGKTLTVVVFMGGLLLATLYLYEILQGNPSPLR